MSVVTLGIGGVLHDYTAAVCRDGLLTAMAVGADVVGLPHGVDVATMQRTFERMPAERAVGRWLLTTRESGVVDATVRAALDAAGVAPDEVTVVGHTCPDLLIPASVRGRRAVPVNQLDAHAAGVVEAAAGDVVIVFDGTGDRDARGVAETGAVFRVGDELRRDWTVWEPASLGVLLDSVGLLAGLAALDRDAAADLFTAATDADPPLKASIAENGYDLDGLAWRQMVRPEERERYVTDRGFDRTRPSHFAGAALAAAVTIARGLVERYRAPGRRLWLAGDALLHPPFARAVDAPDVRATRWPGDEGTAIGAARIAHATRELSTTHPSGGIPWES